MDSQVNEIRVVLLCAQCMQRFLIVLSTEQLDRLQELGPALACREKISRAGKQKFTGVIYIKAGSIFAGHYSDTPA